MAVLGIVELSSLARDANGHVIQSAQMPIVAEQAVTYTTETKGAALNAATRFVRLSSDTTCVLSFGGTATAGGACRLPAGVVEFFGVVPGTQISVVTAS